MKTSRHVMLGLALVAVAAQARGQALAPGTPLPQGNAQNEAAPDLLPRTDALPDPAPLFPDPSSSPKTGTAAPAATPVVSEEQRREDEKRLVAVRSVAMQNAQALGLLQDADAALSVEARRNYLRAYYTTVCNRMRQMEPRLTAYIRAYERSQIRAVGRSKDPRGPNSGLVKAAEKS
ncbi:MAG TPA: hypothetical protein VGD78_18155 [Chthoniobacterales bacterium]